MAKNRALRLYKVTIDPSEQRVRLYACVRATGLRKTLSERYDDGYVQSGGYYAISLAWSLRRAGERHKRPPALSPPPLSFFFFFVFDLGKRANPWRPGGVHGGARLWPPLGAWGGGGGGGEIRSTSWRPDAGQGGRRTGGRPAQDLRRSPVSGWAVRKKGDGALGTLSLSAPYSTAR